MKRDNVDITAAEAVRAAALFLLKGRRPTLRNAYEEVLANPVIWGAALGFAPNRVRAACAVELRRLDEVAA